MASAVIQVPRLPVGEVLAQILYHVVQSEAEKLGCERVALLDAGQVIRCSDLDGIHYEVDQHELLGLAAADAVRGALAPPLVSIE